jgi:hypothetical protein
MTGPVFPGSGPVCPGSGPADCPDPVGSFQVIGYRSIASILGSAEPRKTGRHFVTYNYFLWEFNARMALARKSFQDHITFKLEDAVLRHTNGWIASDLKAFAILAEMLPPVYQSMLRKARSTVEAWKTLKVFFLKQSLHNRVLLCKEFHELVMTSGENLMDHVVRFDDICAKLSAVGEKMGEDYECKQEGHKKAACPRLKSATNSGGGEFVLSATRGAGADQSVWLLDSGASSHMCGERKDFVEFRTLPALFDITVANGQRLQAVGGGSVRLTDRNDAKVKLTVLYCTCQGSTVSWCQSRRSRQKECRFSSRSIMLLMGRC